MADVQQEIATRQTRVHALQTELLALYASGTYQQDLHAHLLADIDSLMDELNTLINPAGDGA
jgi:hypothetical protein